MKIMDSDKNSRKDDCKIEVNVSPRTLSNLPLVGLMFESTRIIGRVSS